MMNILFYINLVCLVFNMVCGMGRLVLGTPGWWVNFVVAVLNGICVWQLHRERQAT